MIRTCILTGTLLTGVLLLASPSAQAQAPSMTCATEPYGAYRAILVFKAPTGAWNIRCGGQVRQLCPAGKGPGLYNITPPLPFPLKDSQGHTRYLI